MSRTVSAVVTSGARCLGVVGPFPVDVAWWPEVEPIVAHLRGVLGVPVFVLRLLTVDGGEGARGGHVTYHVEAPGATRVLRPCAEDVLEHADLRAPWARPDGLRELLDWAANTLAALGRPVTGPVEQRKTWNLAGLFRLPTAGGPVWLKAIAAFAADEGRVLTELARVSPGLVPDVLATGPGRLLMSHVPGEDSWDAAPEIIESGVRRLVAAQAALAGPVPWLPDRRTPAMVKQVHALLDRGLDLSGAEVAAARELLIRWSEVDSCGLPDTIVHGDFHSGNMRSDGGPPVVLDFADAYYGNPVIDGLRIGAFLPEHQRPAAAQAWLDACAAEWPDSDPARALALAGPLEELANAVRYQEFLDGIEPSERVYHEGDPEAAVRRAVRRVGAPTGT